MRHTTNLPQNPKKGTLLWHRGRAPRVHRDAGTWSAENISRWFTFFKGSLDGYFSIKKCLKCFNTKIMYKMFLKICKSGHLKIFKSIQLRLMLPPSPVSLPGISACLRNGLHEESIICPRKHFKSNQGLILIIYQHI